MEKIILHATTSDELKAIVSEAISDQLSKFFEQKKEPDTKLMSRKETAEMLGISLPTLSEWTKNGIITGSRIGSRVRYSTADVRHALKTIQSVKFNHMRP